MQRADSVVEEKVSQGVVFAEQTKLEDCRKENARSIETKRRRRFGHDTGGSMESWDG